MNRPTLLNPQAILLADVEQRLQACRKTQSLWAKQCDTPQQVESLEGPQPVNPGDYLCRGVAGEYWPQNAGRLFDRFSPSDEFDSEGWRRFDPKLGAPAVRATQIPHPFRIIALWGELTGKPFDYVVRSVENPQDIWIVDREIFESTYEFV